MGMEARSSAAFNIMSLFFTCGSKNDLPHFTRPDGFDITALVPPVHRQFEADNSTCRSKQ